jgi:hypothetical protein
MVLIIFRDYLVANLLGAAALTIFFGAVTLVIEYYLLFAGRLRAV